MSNGLLDSTLVQSIGWALIHSIWQGALIGGTTALLLRAIDPQKANMRYFVACLGLVLMPIAPVFSILTNDPYTAELVTASPSVGTATVVDRSLPSRSASGCPAWFYSRFVLLLHALVSSG